MAQVSIHFILPIEMNKRRTQQARRIFFVIFLNVVTKNCWTEQPTIIRQAPVERIRSVCLLVSSFFTRK